MNLEEQVNHSIRAIKMPDEPHPLRKKWWEFCWWLEEKNPFTRFIFVKNAQEYMDMPRKDRTYMYFWYLDGIINDGTRILGRKSERDTIDNFLKYKFPVQYWLRQTGFALKIILSKAYDETCYFLNPRQKWLTKQIPNSWCDKVNLVTDINFAMIVHFVEGEKCFENTDYEGSGEAHAKFAKELMECYLYIKTRRPMLEKQYWNSFPSDEAYTGDYNTDYAEVNRLEKEMDEQDTKWLTWIVTNRKFLWT
jgi:hypothetical protein